MKFNSAGEAAYGYSVVNIDGAIPAALVGLSVGQPSWRSSTQLIYQDCTSGTCTVNQLVRPATITTVSATGANFTGGGGGVWAKWLGSEGLTTSSGLTLPLAGLAWQSRGGETVVVDAYQSAGPITVYDSAGVALPAAINDQLDGVVLVNNRNVRLQDDLLVYQDALGYHMLDVSDGTMPSWYPRTDGVSVCVPVVFNGRTYVLEGSNMLTLRQIDRSKGWILREGPFDFNPDIVAFGSTLRAGSCTDIGETVNSLTTFDISFTGDNISVIVGTVSGGGMVYAAPVIIPPSKFTVGPLEGNSAQPDSNMPVRQNVLTSNGKADKAWQHYWKSLETFSQRTANVVQNWPPPVPPVAFDQVASSGQPTAQAQPGATVLNIETASKDRLTVMIDPATNTVTLDALGVSYVPVATGAEPLVIMSNGAGSILLTPYTP